MKCPLILAMETNMRVAFDVKGTLEGVNQAQVRALLFELKALGCEITIWSNMFTFAVDMHEELGLNASVRTEKKFSKGDCVSWNHPMFDLCIEDDPSQTWLGAKNFLLVRDLPSGIEPKDLAKQIVEKYENTKTA